MVKVLFIALGLLYGIDAWVAVALCSARQASIIESGTVLIASGLGAASLAIGYLVSNRARYSSGTPQYFRVSFAVACASVALQVVVVVPILASGL